MLKVKYSCLIKHNANLVLPLADGALQLEHQLLGGLGLLPQDGLGLASEALLLAVVPGSRAASRHGVTRRHDPRVTARDKCDKMICDDFIPTSALGILGLSGLLVLGHLQSECIADTIVRYYKNAMHLP